MTFQAALCAAERGCCGQWDLGEAAVEWRRLQDKLQVAFWLGTFHGSFALGPDTVEGRYLAGEPWNEELPSRGGESVAARHQRIALAEFDSAVALFNSAFRVFHAALRGLDAGPDLPASGSYQASIAALYEVAEIRTVDEGLLRWLSRGPFRARSVAEFGALTGRSAEWLNRSGAVTGAWAYDGVRGIGRLTGGRVAEVDLARPFQLPRLFDWALCLEVAEHLPEEALPELLGNLRRHVTEGAVVSWSWCGAGGTGHASCRSPEEAARLLAGFGFVADAGATAEARARSSVWWIARTVQVYRLVDA